MEKFTAEGMECQMCGHKLTEHWKEGCGCKRNDKLIIECGCSGYFPKGDKYTHRPHSKYSVEDAKLTILRELGY